jgi:hypothetical protein
MDRELRRLRRVDVQTAAEKQEIVTASFNQVDDNYKSLVKIPQAHVKNYSDAIVKNRVQFAKLQKMIDEYTKYVEDLELIANVRGNQLQMQEKILVRAFHIELRAEYASLSFPPTPNEFLPNLTFNQWSHWAHVYGWCTDEEDKKKSRNYKKNIGIMQMPLVILGSQVSACCSTACLFLTPRAM